MSRDVIHDKPFFDSKADRIERSRTRYRKEFIEAGWYPDMVHYFRHKYNPREESLRDFMMRERPNQVRFLKRRGWDEESINLAWTEIMVGCAHKHSNFAAAVEAMRRTDRYRRRYKIDGQYIRAREYGEEASRFARSHRFRAREARLPSESEAEKFKRARFKEDSA